MVTKDEWARAAMTDDMVVVELLLRLKHQSHASPSPPPNLSLPPLKWGHRQRRSKTLRCDRKDADSARFSPTTPLSWTGGAASPSVTADGFEESSRSPSSHRSKATVSNEATRASSKRPRRKKYAELKNEEFFLMKETAQLKKELATVHATMTEQRARNESLKRIKLDLAWHSAKDSFANFEESKDTMSDHHNQMVLAASSSLVRPAVAVETSASESGKIDNAAANKNSCFLLPDLNMTPSEEDDSVSETLYGIS